MPSAPPGNTTERLSARDGGVHLSMTSGRTWIVDRLPAPAFHFGRRAAIFMPATVVPGDVSVRIGDPAQRRQIVGEQPVVVAIDLVRIGGLARRRKRLSLPPVALAEQRPCIGSMGYMSGGTLIAKRFHHRPRESPSSGTPVAQDESRSYQDGRGSKENEPFGNR